MRRKKLPTRAEKRADDAWVAGHMRAAAVSVDELAYRWEKVLGPRHHVIVGIRELAADARWVARIPCQDAVNALADRLEVLVAELEKLVAPGQAADRRAPAAARTGKRKKNPRPRLRLLHD